MPSFFHQALPLGVVILLTGCATASTVLDGKNDPSSATAAEGSSVVRPTSLRADAPNTSDTPPPKDAGDSVGNMMPGMTMPAQPGDSAK
jgi:hypothetical protein